MMDLAGLGLLAMIVIMIVMCGGMVLGIGWAALRGRKRHQDKHRTRQDP